MSYNTRSTIIAVFKQLLLNCKKKPLRVVAIYIWIWKLVYHDLSKHPTNQQLSHRWQETKPHLAPPLRSMSITYHPIKLRSPFHCRFILICPHSHHKPRNRGPNSVANIKSALTVVPHYSHFICKLAFTCSVSQLSLPLPVSLKDPVSDWSPPHSVNQRTH